MSSPLHRAAAGLLLLMLGAGCRDGVTPIEDILDDPAQYERKTVRIAGNVESALGVLGYGAYRVDDGTGELTVLTRDAGAPREGAKIGVEGEFRSAFTLGSITGAVLMERRRFTP